MKIIRDFKRVLSIITLVFIIACQSNESTKPPNDETPPQIHLDWKSIPAGDFTYGSNDDTLNINYNFDIMKFEVTNEQYLTYLNEAISRNDITVVNGSVTGYYAGDNQYDAGEYEYYKLDGDVTGYTVKMITWDGSRFSIKNGYENHPVIFVSWFGANAFAKHYGYRLPTEQEWEKASRGNSGYNFPWGDSIDGGNANFWDSGDPFDNGTTPVGYYNGNKYDAYQTIDSPSQYGIYDMAGNVWEWTDSFFNNSSSHRVARGGSYGSYSIYLYCFERHRYVSTFTDVNVGFRCVKEN